MVYVLLVDGFEEVEAIEPIDILRRGGVELRTAGVYGKSVTGSHGIQVTADIDIDEVDEKSMELLILPGGPGHTLIEKSEKAKLLIEKAAADAMIAAICASPSILGKMGILKGRKAVCFPGFEKFLDGAKISEEKTAFDGNIITGRGAGAAAEFGFMILGALKGQAKADEIKDVMQY